MEDENLQGKEEELREKADRERQLRGSLGQTTSPEVLASPGLPSRYSTTVGIILQNDIVSGMIPGSPAQLSGTVQIGDKILSVDGRLLSSHAIEAAIMGVDVEGTAVDLELERQETGIRVTCKLSRVPAKSLASRSALYDALLTLRGRGQQRGDGESVRAAGRAMELLNTIMQDVHRSDLQARHSFRELYSRMREQLLQALKEQEALSRQPSFSPAPLSPPPGQTPEMTAFGPAAWVDKSPSEAPWDREVLQRLAEELEAEKEELERKRAQLAGTQERVHTHLQDLTDHAHSLRADLAKAKAELEDKDTALERVHRETERMEDKLVKQQEANQALVDYCDTLRAQLTSAQQANQPPRVGLIQQATERSGKQQGEGQDPLQAMMEHNRALGESIHAKAPAPQTVASEWSSRVKELEQLLEDKESQLATAVRERAAAQREVKEQAFKAEAEAGRMKHSLAVAEDKREAAERRYQAAQDRFANAEGSRFQAYTPFPAPPKGLQAEDRSTFA